MSYKQLSLFGGSITVDYPSDFADVSDIRQLPDNQEVYLDQNGFTSIIVEILEYVDKPHLQALEYHLHDIVEEDASETKIITTAEAHLSKLPTNTAAYTLIAVSPPGEKQRGRPHEPDFVALYLTLIRLPEKKTDILATVNVPFVPGEYKTDAIDQSAARFGDLGDRAQQIREKILQTFDIKDWNLFVNDD